MKKTTTLIFFFLLILPIVFSVPPVQVYEPDVVDSLQLQYTALPYMKTNTDYLVGVHVYNTSSGFPISNDVSCHFHVYNVTLNEIINIEKNTPTKENYFAFYIGGKNFTEVGTYAYEIHCNTSLVGGFVAGLVTATETGEPYTDNLILMAILILLPLIFIFILLFGTVFMSDEHTVLKIIVWLLTPVFFFLSFHLGLISVAKFYYFPSLQNLIGTSTYWIGIVSSVFITYFIIYLFYKLTKQAAQEDEELEY